MGFTLKEICKAVGGYTEGDATIIVNSVAEPGLASETKPISTHFFY